MPGADATHRSELQRVLGTEYELRGLLGKGGFAEVYEVWDLVLRRPLAIKTLRADLVPSAALLERFRMEAEAIAKLRHPHIIPIYAVGGDHTTAFFVMPKIDGESLAEALRDENRFSVAESRRILDEAADALATAHRAGIIHRDIKPENIMLDGPHRRVIVMDFGIAKSVDSGAQHLTGTGIIVGTPHYMSPEQATGEKRIDQRSDQYSLAVVGYRMLSGVLPFDGDTIQSLIVQKLTTTPRPLLELAPSVPEKVGDVIDRALSTHPEDRFSTLEEFANALRSITDNAESPTGSHGLGVRRRSSDKGTKAATSVPVGDHLHLMRSPHDGRAVGILKAVAATAGAILLAVVALSQIHVGRAMVEGTVRGEDVQFTLPASAAVSLGSRGGMLRTTSINVTGIEAVIVPDGHTGGRKRLEIRTAHFDVASPGPDAAGSLALDLNEPLPAGVRVWLHAAAPLGAESAYRLRLRLDSILRPLKLQFAGSVRAGRTENELQTLHTSLGDSVTFIPHAGQSLALELVLEREARVRLDAPFQARSVGFYASDRSVAGRTRVPSLAGGVLRLDGLAGGDSLGSRDSLAFGPDTLNLEEISFPGDADGALEVRFRGAVSRLIVGEGATVVDRMPTWLDRIEKQYALQSAAGGTVLAALVAFLSLNLRKRVNS